MDDNYHLSEMMRKLSNMIRIGNIHAVDAANARVKVSLQEGEIVTAFLPWISGRAGSTSFFSSPDVGEQCIIFAPDGETANAVVLTGIYQDTMPAPAQNKDIHHIKFKDGGVLEYNQETGNLTANVKGGVKITAAKSVDINVDAAVNIKAPSHVNITGNVNVTGNISATGGIAADGAMTSKGSISADGDVKAGDISLQGHIHTGDDGGTTGVAR